MASKNRLNYWTPDITYRVELIIDGKSYTQELVRLKIRSSMEIPYQSVDLYLSVDPGDIIQNQLFGQNSITLQITLLGVESKTEETFKFELMYLSSESDLMMKPVEPPEQDQKDFRSFFIPTICRTAYKTMLTAVNEIYPSPSMKDSRPALIAYDLIKKTGGTPDVDFGSGMNNTPIDQIVIPPNTLFNSIEYLDKTYGIYNGPKALWCSFDNTVHLMNLNTEIQASESFTVYYLASSGDNSKYFNSNDPTLYYTHDNISASYRGNAIFSYMAPTSRYVVKPRDTLFKIIQSNLEAIGKENSTASKKTAEILFDRIGLGAERITFYGDYTGYDDDTSFIKAMDGKVLYDLSNLVITMQNRLPVINLLEVGSATLFKSVSPIYKEYDGRYILKASEVSLIKGSKTWESSARIYLNRTNRTEKTTDGSIKQSTPATENFGSAPVKIDSISEAQEKLENKIEESKNTIQQAQDQASQVQANAAQAASGNFELNGPIKEGGLTQSPEEMANIKQIAGASKELSQDSQKTLAEVPDVTNISEAKQLNSSGENALENYMNKKNLSGADLTEGEQKALTRTEKACLPQLRVTSAYKQKCDTKTGQWENDFGD